MLFYKLLTILVVGLIFWQVYELWRIGRKLRKKRDDSAPARQLNYSKMEYNILY